MFCIVVVPFYIPTDYTQGFQSSHILTNTCFLSLSFLPILYFSLSPSLSTSLLFSLSGFSRYLWSNSSLILFLLKKVLCKISIFFNLMRIFYGLEYGLFWWMFGIYLEKNVHFAIMGWSIDGQSKYQSGQAGC